MRKKKHELSSEEIPHLTSNKIQLFPRLSIDFLHKMSHSGTMQLIFFKESTHLTWETNLLWHEHNNKQSCRNHDGHVIVQRHAIGTTHVTMSRIESVHLSTTIRSIVGCTQCSVQ